MGVFAARRQNMVECQIRTNRVTDEGLIGAFAEMPRECFVAPDQQGVAYIDEDLPLAEGRFMLEPMVLARMIQALELSADDSVLDIAAGTGYSTAIIARLVASVVGIESNRNLRNLAEKQLQELEIDNAVMVAGNPPTGYPKEAPYDAIIIQGAAETIPQNLLAQLSPSGRLVAIMRQAGQPVGRVTLFRAAGDGYASQVLFDAQSPSLQEFAKPRKFSF